MDLFGASYTFSITFSPFVMLLYPTTVLALAAFAHSKNASKSLWYTSPAEDFASTLPIGNGRLAGAIWGSALETVILNENSVWSGPFQNRVNPNASKVLPQVRSELGSGDITAGGNLALANMAGNPTSARSYNPLVNLTLDFGHDDSDLEGYTRSLDVEKGNVVVGYGANGVHYR